MFKVSSRGVVGSRLIANSNAASQSLPLVVSGFIWPNVLRADPQYNVSDGVLTFTEDCFFSSTVTLSVQMQSGNGSVFADAQVFVGGVWVIGTESARQLYVKNGDQAVTANFSFDGFFAAGTILRFAIWSNSANLRLVTTSLDGGSIAPAARLTYACLSGKLK